MAESTRDNFCEADVVCSANESVLRWWFRDKPASLVVDSSLVVEMMSVADDQTQWTIYITGRQIRLSLSLSLSVCVVYSQSLISSLCASFGLSHMP